MTQQNKSSFFVAPLFVPSVIFQYMGSGELCRSLSAQANERRTLALKLNHVIYLKRVE